MIRRWRAFLFPLLIAALAAAGYAASVHWRAASWRNAADQALRSGEYAEAMRSAARVLDLRPGDAQAYLLLGRAARSSGQMKEAARCFAESLRLGADPETVALEEQLAQVQAGNLSTESRLRAYVANDHPESDAILTALAQGQVATFRISQALTTLDELLRRRPDFVPGWTLKAQAFFHLRNYGEVAAAYRRALELRPQHDAARTALADCLLLLNQPAEALEHYQAAREARPFDADIRLGLARALIQLGRADEAREHAEAALEGTRRAEAMYTLGKLDLDLERPAAAEPWLRKAVELIPHERDAVNALVICLGQLNRPEEARKWQEQLRTIDRQRARLRALVKVINARPDDPEPRLEAGRIFLETGQDTEGVRWLESALQADPEHVGVHRVLADHYRRKNDDERAARHEKLAAQSP